MAGEIVMPAALLALAVLLLPLVAADPADHVGVRRIGGATQVLEEDSSEFDDDLRLLTEEEEEGGDPRILFTSTTTVTTNSTLLRAIGALVGLLLLTLPLYLAYATALGGDDSGYAYGYSKRRGKRQADGGEEDFPSYYLYLLLESFRRRGMGDEDVSCHLLSACLAGRERRDWGRGEEEQDDVRVELFKILRSASTNVDDQEFMSLAPAPLREMMEAFRRGFDDGGGGRGDCRLYHTDNKKCKILQEPP